MLTQMIHDVVTNDSSYPYSLHINTHMPIHRPAFMNVQVIVNVHDAL